MDELGEDKRTKKNLIVRSGISEAETTNNKKNCARRFVLKPHRNEASRGLFATAELLVSVSRFAEENRLNLFLRIGKSQGEVTNKR